MTTIAPIDPQRILDNIERVRTTVGVAQRVLQMLDDPEFEMHRVVSVLETDPALATQILKLVNSSYFGLSRRIATLQHAVSCLGAHTLRLALLNYGVLQCMAQILPVSHREVFLRRSLTMAVVADKLVRFAGQGDADEAYCAGLIADIGSLALAQAEPKRYLQLLAEAGSDQELLAAERETFGVDHANLGGRLLRQWNLPDAIVEAVSAHHASLCAEETPTLPVQVATLVAEALWTPKSPSVSAARTALAEHYGFSTDDFIQLAVDCKGWLAEHAGTMNLYLRTEIDVEELRRQALERFVAESVATAVELDGLEAVTEDRYPHFA